MISFIILHYKNIKDTIECIESIKKINGKYNIIVVDNNSTDKKEEKLIKKYCDDFIKLDENLGFAKANNIGCKYAIDKYKPDYLVVSNNDIVIEDEDFINKINKEYKKSKFDILGPKINTDNGQSVNPFPVYKTKEEVIKQINKTKKLIKIYNNILLRNIFNIYMNIKYKFKEKKLVYNGNNRECNVALHGCFIVFSKKYFERYEHVFYNETFLYHEEEFLYQRIIKDKLISIYEPSLEVFHKEGASLDFNYKNNYKKLIFKNNEIIRSLELLLNEIN
ncbi:MAG: glycosyltransferase family 2 protein [Firmicutes bacterium]|nr:glycosyltransferase family 2 protein [Bacillota bacterium]